MSDNNLDTETAKPEDKKIRDLGEEMSYQLEMGENRNPTIYLTGIEGENEFATNILLQKYGRPKREEGRIVRMSYGSQKVTGVKRNLVRMAKRGILVRMAKQPSPKQLAKRANLVRIAKWPSLVGRDKKSGLVRMAKRHSFVRMAKRHSLVRMAKRSAGLVRMAKRTKLLQMLHGSQKVTGIKRNQVLRIM